MTSGSPPFANDTAEQCTVVGCDRPVNSHGWCKRHYDRWHRRGSPDFPPAIPLLARVLARTRREQECLVWNGPTTDPHGRGQVRWQGRATWAHRVIWELQRGALPPSTVLRHTCDVAGCLNIDHLRPGTQADNMRDMQARGRGRQQVCRNGLHPLTGTNVYRMPHNPTYRECRPCRNARNVRYHQRRAAVRS
jgi:hypothetical protein